MIAIEKLFNVILYYKPYISGITSLKFSEVINILTEDKISNKEKSKSGNDFNKEMNTILLDYIDNGLISNYCCEPRLTIPGYSYEQFRPDFKIETNNNTIIFIDNTKTVRGDRIKQKQWDAMGVKQSFSNTDNNVLYFVVVPPKSRIGHADTREKEINNVIHERTKIKNPNYFSKIDDILFLDEFLDVIKSI